MSQYSCAPCQVWVQSLIVDVCLLADCARQYCSLLHPRPEDGRQILLIHLSFTGELGYCFNLASGCVVRLLILDYTCYRSWLNIYVVSLSCLRVHFSLFCEGIYRVGSAGFFPLRKCKL